MDPITLALQQANAAVAAGAAAYLASRQQQQDDPENDVDMSQTQVDATQLPDISFVFMSFLVFNCCFCCCLLTGCYFTTTIFTTTTGKRHQTCIRCRK